jgi:cadmium resistance protein CadD (predicted permease)
MQLLILLLVLFAALALLVVLGERFARPPSPEQLARLRRWLLPLVGALLVLSLVDYYWA